MAEGTEVGKAYVSLEANSAGLDAGLKQGEAKVEQFATQTTRATARGAKGFAGFGKSVRDTIKPITSLVGGVTAAIGTFGLFVSLGERLGRTIFGLNEQGQTQQEAILESSGDVARSLLMGASGLRPLDPKTEAEKEKLDKEIRRKVLEIEQTRTGGTAVPLSPEARENIVGGLQNELSALQERRRMISGGERRAQIRGMAPQARIGPPAPLSGLSGGGDPNVLRMLQSIDRQLQRRGIDQ